MAKNKTMSEHLCHCGKPLHYNNPDIKRAVDKLVEGNGEYITITSAATGRSFRVQRHYIALHGVKERDLPNLGFEEITDGGKSSGPRTPDRPKPEPTPEAKTK
jgi:hypothetical protein